MAGLAPKRLERCFTRCLQQGVFLHAWKQAGLVLVPKVTRRVSAPSSFRPLCLLDEISKLFERVLTGSLEACL